MEWVDPERNRSNDDEIWNYTQQPKCKCKYIIHRGRNLVICIDGTSNQFGRHNTNVIELYNQLLKNEEQLTYYDSGIGTYATPSWKSWNYWKQIADNKIDLAIAWNFETIVINAYRWLAEHYQLGDRIFLFGFSRGAYQVRTLAGMIHKVGLIYKGNERQIPFAYEVYADPRSGEPFSSPDEKMVHKARRKFGIFHDKSSVTRMEEMDQSPAPNLAQRFKDTFSRDVQVHFVGVWDTVSSIGIVRGKNLPGTTSSSPHHICFFRHALALDERRVKFLPEYIHGGLAADPDAMKGSMPHVKETWFTGTHSDIGGGNVLNPDLNRSGPPLLWMSYEAISAGLSMKLSNVEWKWEQLGKVNESLKGVWKLFEFIPFKRLTYKDSVSTTSCWHRGKSRHIQPGQKIHASVAFSPQDYHPKAVFPPEERSKKIWGDLIKLKGKTTEFVYPEEWKDCLEMDMFDFNTANAVVNELEKQSVDPLAWVHRLKVMTKSPEGRDRLRRVYNAANRVFSTLERPEIKANTKLQADVVNALIQFAKEVPRMQDRDSLQLLSPLLRDPLLRESAGQFVCKFCPAAIYKMLIDLKLFSSVANIFEGNDHDTEKLVLDEITLSSNYGGAFQSRTVENLLTILASNKQDTAMRILSLRGLIKLESHVPSVGEVFTSNLSSLVESLWDRNHIIRRLAFVMIWRLIRRGDTRRQLLQCNLVQDALIRSRDEETQRSTLEIIALLAGHDEWHECLLQSEAMIFLREGLQSSSWIIQRSAIQGIAVFAKYDNLRNKMLNPSFFNFLARMLVEPNEGSHLVPWIVIVALKKYGSLSLSPLLDSLEHSQPVTVSLCKVILKLVKFQDRRAKMPKVDMLDRLLQLFQDSDWRKKCRSLYTSAALAQFEDCRSKIVEEDILVRLVKLNQGSNSDMRLSLNTFSALRQFENRGGKKLEDDMPDRLGQLFQDPNWRVQHSSIDTFGALVQFDDCREKMIGGGILDHLIKLFQDSDSDVRRLSCEAFSALVQFEDGRAKMLKGDMADRLYQHLQDSDYSGQPSFITTSSAARDRFEDCRDEKPEGYHISHLIKLCQDWNWDVPMHAFSLPWGVPLEDFPEIMLVNNKLHRLIKLLQDSDSDIQSLSMKIFTALTQFEGCRATMLESDIIKLFQHSHSDVQRWCIHVLVQFEDCRTKMLDGDMLDRLNELLHDSDSDVRRLSINIFNVLGSFEDCRAKMVVGDMLDRLIKLFQDSDSDVQRLSLNTFSVLAQFDDCRVKMLEDEMLDRMIQFLQGSDPDVQCSSIKALRALAQFEDCRAKMLEGDMLIQLLQLFPGSCSCVRRLSIKTFGALAEFDDGRAKMVEGYILDSLTKLFQDWDLDVQRSSIKTFSVLTRFKNCRTKMLEGDVLGQLVQLFQSSYSDVRCLSVNAFGALVQFEDCRAKIVEGYILDHLIKLFQDSNWLLQSLSINTAMTLIRFDDCRAKMLEGDMLDQLVQLFQGSYSDIRCLSINIFSALVQFEDCRAKLVGGDILDRLIELFRDSNWLIQCWSINIFCTLARFENCRQKMLEGDMLDPLVQLFQDSCLDVQCFSIATFSTLVQFEDFRAKTLESDILRRLIKLLQGSNSDAQGWLINVLTQFEDFREKMLEGDILDHLINLSQDSDSDAKHLCINVFTALVPLEDSRAKMVEGGILDRLIQLPRHSDLGVQHSFLKFFATLAQFENCRAKMLDGDMFDGLKELAQYLHPEVRQSSLKIFRDLIQFEDCRAKMVKSEILNRLIKLSQSSDWLLQVWFIDTLSALISFEDCRAKMLEVDILDHLIRLSKTWDPRVKRPSIDSFSILVQFEDCRAKMVKENRSLFSNHNLRKYSHGQNQGIQQDVAPTRSNY